MAGFGSRRKAGVIGNRGEVGILAAPGAGFLIDAAVIAAVVTGLFHSIPFL